jgi:hypothetical protein
MIQGVNAFDSNRVSWACLSQPRHPEIRFTQCGERQHFVIREKNKDDTIHLADFPLLLDPTSDAASETWFFDAPTEQTRFR